MADTSSTLVFIRTHPLFLADTSTLGLGCTHSVLGRHMWHFSLQLHTHPVLGRHQCQVSLQSDSPSTLADTSVRSVFSQTHPHFRGLLVTHSFEPGGYDRLRCVQTRDGLLHSGHLLHHLFLESAVSRASQVSQSIHQGGAA